MTDVCGSTSPIGWLDRRFELAARGSSARTEVLAGLTTFLTMAYIIAVNPAVLGQAGMPVAAVAAATCFAAGVASIAMELVANVPLALAPGMGLFIGLRNAGLVVSNPATGVALGDLHAPGTLLAIRGWAAGTANFQLQPYSLRALGDTAFRLDLAGVFGGAGRHGLGLLEVLFVFLFVDLFDNLETLVAVTRRAGLVDAGGRIARLNPILFTDAAATMVGALAGASTVTSYVESAAGVQAGGRTGLTAIAAGVLFLLAMFAAPYAKAVPLAATSPALILVGALMMALLADIAWEEPEAAILAFLTVATIPLTFSIANGLGFGITAHALIKSARGRVGRGDTLLLIRAGLFAARFAWLAAD